MHGFAAGRELRAIDDEPPVPSLTREAFELPGGQFFERATLLVGAARECIDARAPVEVAEAFVHGAVEQGHDRMTQGIALPRGIRVGGILAPSHAALAQEGAQLLATLRAQRTHEGAARRRDAAEAAQATAAQAPQGHGLDVVVEMMAGGDAIETPASPDVFEESMARVSTGGLHPRTRAQGAALHVGSHAHQLDAALRAGLFAGRAIGRAVRTQSVIEVRSHETQLAFGREAMEEIEQGDRIAAAGQAHDQALALHQSTLGRAEGAQVFEEAPLQRPASGRGIALW